jgi:quinol-cytochrome oxidoreductase complex cytochrome b subunit
MHANGASMMFMAVMGHMCRGVYYGSYKGERKKTWVVGVGIYVVMILVAFMGYVITIWADESLRCNSDNEYGRKCD